ncbi:hypothetical protein [Bradyrhizobium sp. SZCCHNR1070]|uniref:hypothetical protein n=1 Tax=Bradyrhizobium sp. SZCCHNR1070 TaxID=3057361 RepID=UPI0029171052|nr:hypothetical protein [Bradyrhizobium sp. SZCCHNR1070]
MLAYLSHFFSGGVDPTWPHAILLSISVLASFAVGAGIIFESHKYSASVQRIAMWSVIVGVIVEAGCTITLFVFDEGISNAQQDKIVNLETRLAFRTLSAEQFEDIVEQLKPTAGQHFQIVTYWQNPESLALTERIYEALNKAGWIFDKPQNALLLLGVETGVIIGFDKRSEAGVSVSKKLIYALLSNNIYAVEDINSVRAPPQEGTAIDNKIIISVGIKP